MNMRIVLLTCALCAAACGSSDQRPASDPSSVAAPSSTTLTGAPYNASDPTPAAQVSPSSTTPSTPSAGPQPTDPNAPSAPRAPADTTTTGAASSQGDAAVIDNPGAHDQTASPDNTRNDDRDRHGTLTPMNQGNSGDETKITAAIRRGLMSDKSLSFTAKNVKIITVGTKVTLRGPVNSDQEKAAIEMHAKQTPGVTDVDDQLEVKK
jgi:hypothetical protein